MSEDDVYEVKVCSRLRPSESYDFEWRFGDDRELDARPGRGDLRRRVVKIARSDGSRALGPANSVWMIPADQAVLPIAPAAMNFRIFSPDIDETIDINLSTLLITDREGEQERHLRMEPWRRYILWLSRLEAIDRAAFRRVPAPLREAMRRFDPRVSGGAPISEADVFTWQAQGFAPAELAMITPNDVDPARDSIRLQQRLAQQPEVVSQFTGCPVPALLLAVDAATLDAADLQILMTIGALREYHGFIEVEEQRLMQRRPDLRAALQKPNGRQIIQADGEVAALLAHPQALKEQQDMQDVMLRRGGSYGPTPRQQLAAMKLQTDQMQAQTLGMINPFMGLAASLASGLGAMPPPGPPWKIYTPYLC